MNGRMLIEECVKLISLSCQLLHVDKPEIYFLYSRKDSFTLYDERAQVISYDRRDVGYQVKAFTYVKKEDALYINMSVLKDEMYRRVMCFRVSRQIYEVDQVIRYRSHLDDGVLHPKVRSWEFAYASSHVESDKIAMPLNVDRSAFAEVMMKEVFNVTVHFKGEYFDEVYADVLQNMKREIDMHALYELLVRYGYMCL